SLWLTGTPTTLFGSKIWRIEPATPESVRALATMTTPAAAARPCSHRDEMRRRATGGTSAIPSLWTRARNRTRASSVFTDGSVVPSARAISVSFIAVPSGKHLPRGEATCRHSTRGCRARPRSRRRREATPARTERLRGAIDRTKRIRPGQHPRPRLDRRARDARYRRRARTRFGKGSRTPARANQPHALPRQGRLPLHERATSWTTRPPYTGRAPRRGQM